MIHLRHILHPIRSANSLYHKVRLAIFRQLTEHRFRNIRRNQRNRCWCGGELLPFTWHSSYGVCVACGCYVNRHPPITEELKRFYSFDNYWGAWMRLKGAPTIDHRTENDLKDGRVAYWFSLIQQYGPSSGRVIEVGCGHAVLLRELNRRGYDCIGVEPSEDVSDWIRARTGLQIITGLFPQVDLPECDMFLAFDVLEHVHNPFSFMEKVFDILRPGGIAILQQPTIRAEQGDDIDPPFGNNFERMFDDVEHLWIFTSAGLNRLANLIGFDILDDKARWQQCHEIVVLRRQKVFT